MPSKLDVHNSIGLKIFKMEGYVIMDEELRVVIKLMDGNLESNILRDRNDELCSRNEKLLLERIYKREMAFKSEFYFKVSKTML